MATVGVASLMGAALPLPTVAHEEPPITIFHDNPNMANLELEILKIVDNIHARYPESDKNYLKTMAYFQCGKYISIWNHSISGSKYKCSCKDYATVHVIMSLDLYCRKLKPYHYEKISDGKFKRVIHEA
jgi:hypothetical protein